VSPSASTSGGRAPETGERETGSSREKQGIMDYDALELMAFWLLAGAPGLVLVITGIVTHRRHSGTWIPRYLILGILGCLIRRGQSRRGRGPISDQRLLESKPRRPFGFRISSRSFEARARESLAISHDPSVDAPERMREPASYPHSVDATTTNRNSAIPAPWYTPFLS